MIVDTDARVLLDMLVRPVFQTERPEAQAIHGISSADLISAPMLDKLRSRLRRSLQAATWCSTAPRSTSRF